MRHDRYGERIDDDSVTSFGGRRCVICGSGLSTANRTHCCAECRLLARNGDMESEVWLPVVGHRGWEISDRGRVRDAQIHKICEPDRAGRYPRVWLSGRRRYVHQLMAETWLGPRPWGQLALHDDDDPDHTHIANIRWGTPVENAADAKRNRALVANGAAERKEHRDTTDSLWRGPVAGDGPPDGN